MLRKKRLYVPAVTLVMVVVTLVVMHAISAFRTLNREWSHWEAFLERNARDVISATSSGSGTEEEKGELQRTAERIAQNPDIAYFGFMDDKGEWTLGGPQSDHDGLSLWGKEGWNSGQEKGSYHRIGKLPDGRSVFQYWEYLSSRTVRAAAIGLWMTPFEEARKQDIRHDLMMAAILLILGSAALYFIFVIQNYYLVDKTLGEMRSYTENVVESMANGLITVDIGGLIVSTNRRASEILALDTKLLWGRPLKDLIAPTQLDIEKVIESNKSVTEREIEYSAGSRRLPLSVSATPLKGAEGATMGAVIIVRDLREIRELREKVRRSERLASLGRLASGVAHEVRNPLSSIKGFAQYFRDKFDAGSEDRSYAEIMIQEVERLNRVISDLLDFARPKELRTSPCSPSEILKRPLQLIEGNLRQKGIGLATSLASEGRVEVDSDQMTQALLNLLLNAVESMEEGGELRVLAIPQPSEGRLEIRIADTGAGIAAENRTKIFDPFFSTKKKGTGLGLAITAKIIETHGGEITVESEEGRGTTFTIHLPLAQDRFSGERTNERKDTGR
jgi:two-component system sensor histidine kinase HydH